MSVVVQKKYVALMLLRAYRATEVRVNNLKANIKMSSKEIWLMKSGLNFI
jgi:hypothetical protein